MPPRKYPPDFMPGFAIYRKNDKKTRVLKIVIAAVSGKAGR